jgi:tRNA A-37 threonylcarbamoyl transferase component Bud32
MRDAGVPTAAPFGIVQLTPEREYLLVTEFFDGAVEIGEAVVDDQLIDEGLALVRRLWDHGLAHRDIKPANLMVKDGHLVVIDVAFAQVRPSPWREAVDLANMMLVLAVRTDAERVYRHALAYFSPDEINVAKGTKVRIHGGPYDGLEGSFLKVKGAREKRVVVEISGVIVVATATLSCDLVEVLANEESK